ncbi:hypothetical protein PV10_04734 [Exophiala mesophila]|uniref:EF-hand domain-containing protein n=1 Tax=Exophiala mesophila TaxID=212818 RepID=A0A0D1ZI42_EXOME|nr:uncharacterized protein PV10_04734 [Exophiala mesophila]KIV93524.1 hypothetical protein PV10_04734 [Exophiala mesophila]
MPPRKSTAKSSKPSTSSTPKGRRSALAKENDITAEEEAEIKEAWNMFRLDANDQDVPEEFEDEKMGIVRTRDVSAALRAQSLHPKSASQLTSILETLDPTSTGYVTYAHFVAICALQLSTKTDETRAEEVNDAFALFTNVAGRRTPSGPVASVNVDGEPVINLHDLRAVARLLKQDVSDDVLKAMILEANQGKGVGKGVTVDDFRGVMVRAGVFQE